MRWTERLYAHAFAPHGDFKLREHGARPRPAGRRRAHGRRAQTRQGAVAHVTGERKLGGNAQAATGL